MKERSGNEENLPLLSKNKEDRVRRWVETPAASELTYDSGRRHHSSNPPPQDIEFNLSTAGVDSTSSLLHGDNRNTNDDGGGGGGDGIRIKEVVFHEEVEFNDDLDVTPQKPSWTSKIDIGAFQFGLRMAVMLTFTSLFVLVRTPTYTYPAGMWVLVSTLFVCWFPALDAASVIEKIIQRLIGTFVGAFLGLSCGFLSLLFPNPVYQSAFIAFCMFLINFSIVFLAGQCKVGRVKVIRRFAYATVLCILTFCIALLPFATDSDPKYERALYRVMNVVVGCAIGAAGAITVCPKSTHQVLKEKTVVQVRMAGDACEAVMELAADYLGGGVQIQRLADELVNTPLERELRWKFKRSSSSTSLDSDMTAMKEAGATDVALKKYEDAIADWKQCKLLFPLIKYDPFHVINSQRSEAGKEDQLRTARILARTLRIQTTVVMLDGMIRSDSEYELDDDDIFMFRAIGSCIRHTLKMPIDSARNARHAEKLFEYLEMLRQRLVAIRRASIRVQLNPEREETLNEFYESVLNKENCAWNESVRDDLLGRGLPKNLTESDENTLFFLQLVEHLVLRALRLYQSCKHI